MYVLTAAGITVGYHRMLTHRSFRTHKPTEYVFASLGSMAVQGPVIAWVADHRKHHAHTDVEGDPHSPHVGPRRGRDRACCSGLWHAHMGWLLSEHGRADWKQYAPDLYEDRGMRLINRRFVSLVLLGPRASRRWPATCSPARCSAPPPACSGAAWSASSSSTTSPGASTRSATSSASRRFEVEDQSTNVFWLALPSLGESWHHNHHAFPRSAVHGLRRWELDPSALLIAGDGAGRARLERDPDRARAPGG